MTKDEMEAIFNDRAESIWSFEKLVENKRSKRPDLHAFLLLDSLDPGPNNSGYFVDVIAAAEHDEIWLSFDENKVAEVITREQVIELRRCGVMYRNDGMGFSMFA
jgi:hypothetical protein